MINILRIYPFITEGKGGMENHIRTLSLEQIKLGHSVTILYSQGERVSVNDICIMKVWPYKIIKPQAISFFIFHLTALILLILKRKKFDVVHLHGDWSSILFGGLYKSITRAKSLAFSFHGQVKENFAHTELLPQLISKASVTFVNGFDAFIKYSALGNVIFRPSGVDELFFNEHTGSMKNSQDFNIISVGALIPSKNMLTVLQVAKQLPLAKFTVVGQGPQSNMLTSQSKAMGLSNVAFEGFLSKSKLKLLLEFSDIFLSCSLEEGTPTATLEAMAVGLPIVTSDAGGISSIIKNNVNGFVVDDFNDVDKYIADIRKLMKDDFLREEIGRNNKIVSIEYGWRKAVKAITCQYGIVTDHYQ